MPESSAAAAVFYLYHSSYHYYTFIHVLEDCGVSSTHVFSVSLIKKRLQLDLSGYCFFLNPELCAKIIELLAIKSWASRLVLCRSDLG